MATKYKQYYQEMSDQNEELFRQFQVIHDGYKQDRKQGSQQFHTVGQQVVDSIHEWEQKLCAGMERGKNAQYSLQLSQKFWGEVKKRFSHIELVGVKSNLD